MDIDFVFLLIVNQNDQSIWKDLKILTYVDL